MTSLDSIISEGTSILQNMIKIESNESIRGDIVSRIIALHTQGRFILRKIDKIVFKEYSELFSKTYTSENWDIWNHYLRSQLEKCLGILMAVKNSNPEDIIDTSPKKIFISHGKFPSYFNKIEMFIKALGLIPVFDINEPTQGKTINNHVRSLMDDADFYLILATIETKRGNENLPNHNVIIEYDRLIQSEKHNLLVLMEDDCKMPSMLQDIIYFNFDSGSLDEAFIKVASEFKKSGILN